MENVQKIKIKLENIWIDLIRSIYAPYTPCITLSGTCVWRPRCTHLFMQPTDAQGPSCALVRRYACPASTCLRPLPTCTWCAHLCVLCPCGLPMHVHHGQMDSTHHYTCMHPCQHVCTEWAPAQTVQPSRCTHRHAAMASSADHAYCLPIVCVQKQATMTHLCSKPACMHVCTRDAA